MQLKNFDEAETACWREGARNLFHFNVHITLLSDYVPVVLS